MMYYGIPEQQHGIFSILPLVHYRDTLPFKGATGSLYLQKLYLNQCEK